MKRFIQALGRLVGIHFTPDNRVTPVLRLGRYNRVKGPGIFWIIPLLEQTLPLVKTSLYVGEFVFTDVLTKDNIPFRIHTTVLFTFDPGSAVKGAAAQLVREGEELLRIIVHSFANRRLRRLVATFTSEELSGDSATTGIEEGMVCSLKREMRMLGLKPLEVEYGGVMIKEIIAPENFKRTMLDVKHDEAILEVLRSYPVPELVQLLNQVVFANSLKDHSGDLALMMGAPESLPMLPLLRQNKVFSHNGNNL